jgi:hypothetical protein
MGVLGNANRMHNILSTTVNQMRSPSPEASARKGHASVSGRYSQIYVIPNELVLEKLGRRYTECPRELEYRQMSSREKSKKVFSEFPSFNIISGSLDACLQSNEPVVNDCFEFVAGNPMKHVYDTLEELVFVLECDSHQCRFHLAK